MEKITKGKNTKSTKEDLMVDFFVRNDLMRLVASKKFMKLISTIYMESKDPEVTYICYNLARFMNYRADIMNWYNSDEDYNLMEKKRSKWNSLTLSYATVKQSQWRKKNIKNNSSGGLYFPPNVGYSNYSKPKSKKKKKQPKFKYSKKMFFEGDNTPINSYKLLKKSGQIYNHLRVLNTQKYNFIDISNDGGFISFIPMDKRNEEMWRVGKFIDFKEHKRVKMKIGRFINNLYKSLIDNGFFEHLPLITAKTSKVITPNGLEKFVNMYKCYWGIQFGKEFGKESYEFEILKGEDIKKGYDTKNQLFGGTLRNSCMNNKTKFLDLYSKNKNVSLLTLKYFGKIIGRALLWQTTNGVKIMDRIYYGRDQDYRKFEIYAKKHKYLMKNDIGRKDKYYVQLEKNIEYTTYPYLDSFRYFNRFTDRLQIHRPKYRGLLQPFRFFYNKFNYMDLISTTGGVERWSRSYY